MHQQTELEALASQGWDVIIEMSQAVIDDKLELRLGHAADGANVVIACANGHALAIVLLERPEEGQPPPGATLQ